MELSFVYDSTHFAPFAQPTDGATGGLSRVLLEPAASGFAREAKTALDAAEEKLRAGEVTEAVKHYLAASRAYLSAAAGVRSEHTALALVFLSNTITRKVEDLRKQISSSGGSTNHSLRQPSSNPNSQSENPPLTESQSGRLAFQGVRDKLARLDKVPGAKPQPSVVEDMLALERKLADLGLVQGRPPLEHVNASLRYSSGALGESFYLLGRTPTHMAEFAPMNQDDLNASHVMSVHRNDAQGRPIQPVQMKRASSIEAKVKVAHPAPSVDPLSLSVYPSKAIAESPDAALAMSVNMPQAPATHTNNENISRLLHSMKRLSEENAALLKEREAGMRYLEENKQLRHQTQQFKKDYQAKFATLNKVLHDFAAQYPHEANPANDIHKTDKEKLQRRLADLEKVVKTLLARVESQKKQIETDRTNIAKKDDLIRRYEQVFKEIKDRQKQRRSDDSSSHQHHQQQQSQQQQQQQQGVSTTQPTSAAQPAPQAQREHRIEASAAPGISPSANTQRLGMPPPRPIQRTAPKPSTATMASLSSSGIAAQSQTKKIGMQPVTQQPRRV